MKFSFHTRDGPAFLQDEAGAELADLDAAGREATLAAREMVAELVGSGSSTPSLLPVVLSQAIPTLGCR